MRLHEPGCVYWWIGFARAGCSCPRPWRVRKTRQLPDLYPWRVERLTADGYTLFMRATTFDRAMRLASVLSRIEYSRSAP